MHIHVCFFTISTLKKKASAVLAQVLSWFGLRLVKGHVRSSFLSYRLYAAIGSWQHWLLWSQIAHGPPGLDKPRGRTLKYDSRDINRRGLKLQNSTWLGRPCMLLVLTLSLKITLWQKFGGCLDNREWLQLTLATSPNCISDVLYLHYADSTVQLVIFASRKINVCQFRQQTLLVKILSG